MRIGPACPVLTVLVASAVIGCSSSSDTATDPLPTDGPNQVVIKVPSMT